MKALFQKSKQSLNDNLKQNSMKNLFKTPKGMMRIIKQNAMAVVAIGIAMGSYGLMSFGTSSKSDEMITFEYKPPTGDPSPYSKANVEDLSNWSTTNNQCPTSGNRAACTIQVHEDYTVGGAGEEIDSDLVTLEISASTTGEFKVDAPETASNYMNPINRSTL